MANREGFCRSCFLYSALPSNSLCDPCLRDYRYNYYRTTLLESQRLSNKPLSREGKRWSKKQVKIIKARMEEYIVRLYARKTFTRAEITDETGLSLGLTYQVLNKLMAEGKLARNIHSKNYVTYQVVGDSIEMRALDNREVEIYA